MTAEGHARVPGAVLAYRRAGTGRGPLLVFENGWGASHHNWAWFERQLAPHADLLFYDRAGIGGSIASAPQTVAGLSAQFAALLESLGVVEPVVVVGHSYGGLVGALHLAQQPQAVRSLVQLDASPWKADPVLDAQFRSIRAIIPIVKFYARMGWRDPLFARACRTLPEPEATLLIERAFQSVDSLRAAEAELRLLDGIRQAIASRPSDARRLVLSAGRVTEVKSSLARMLISAERARDVIDRMQAQHRDYAARGEGATWETLPHDHGALVFTEAGAASAASRILDHLADAGVPARH